MYNGGGKQSKDPKFVAKRLERKQKVAIRQKKQAPIVRNAMRNKDCPPQELRKLLRRVPDVLAHNPNFQVVRFCLPDYPRQWIQQEEEVDPFAAYINDAFRGQNYVRWPLDVHLTGGYVLVLLPDGPSAEFARSLLPGLQGFFGTGIREPSWQEVERFHASWSDRSPGMFSRHQKRPQQD
ncbi:uncharacterized protein LOC120422841 isoform X2 [Culex pipiens pallens]|uniref:uncharacterized protein LOC120422841 isoform X2 n=1 Tax=Culex pipiens pallens TaxID=42434 RepID=UPI001954858D|nr:uncharacterized protein LOC120422841 isoform X2 [Culex pipiens pallens]